MPVLYDALAAGIVVALGVHLTARRRVALGV
jgi:hypothetical protein